MARPPSFTPEGAIQAALTLIEKDGLQAFSVEELARSLGVTGPALYHHFDGRDAILEAAAELLYREFDSLASIGEGGDDWRESLVDYARGFRRVIVRYPNSSPLLLSHLSPQVVLPSYEALLKFLENSGVPASHRLMILEGIEKLTLSAAPWFARAIAESASAPHLSAAVAATHDNDDARFVATARTFLRGVDFDRARSVPA